MPAGDILRPDPQALQQSTWTSEERKSLHEDYWGSFIFDFVKTLPADSSFEEAWRSVHYHEFLRGSGEGRTFARRMTNWKSNFTRRGKLKNEADLVTVPFLQFLFEDVSEPISLRVMCLLRKQLIGGLLDGIVPEKTALFDLGSGWGRHSTMFAEKYPQLQVHAGEISSGGQSVTRWFAERYGFSIQAFPFDYLAWKDMVERVSACDREEIVIFTCHSIEQVTFADFDMWAALARLNKSVRFIHLEPVGWQISSNSASRFSRPPDPKQDAQWGYNKNLLSIVDSLKEQGLVENVVAKRDYIAFGNAYNSGTLVTFQNHRGSA